MEIQEEFNHRTHTIKSHTPGQIKVDSTLYSESLIVSPEIIIHPWPVAHVDELNTSCFEPILRIKPALVILGTGLRFHWIDDNLLKPLKNAGIAVECMDTAAACRTYTALASEGRDVMAALIIEKPE